MRDYSIPELKGFYKTYGRTWCDDTTDTLFFNWSGSTVEFRFTGTMFHVTFAAEHGDEPEGPPGDPNTQTRPTWPVIAVFVDDASVPSRKFEITSPRETWLIHESSEPETHRIRITKLTENYKTYAGIAGIRAEGSFLPVEENPRRRMEIVGDSITCGYGNLVNDPNRHFFSIDEDNTQAYGPLTAGMLGMDYSCVSISGITGVKHEDWMMPYAMCELYEYTDRPMQDKLGMPPALHDFSSIPNDYVVVNLGTNDNYAILFSPNEKEQELFRESYMEFIRKIRRVNGPDTQIICALGTMNYYLFYDIAAAVDTLREMDGDEKIHLFRFRPIHPMDGLGADGHPSLKTHRKMAEELSAFIRGLES